MMRSLTLLIRRPKMYILEPSGNLPIKESNRNPSIDRFGNRKEQLVRFLTSQWWQLRRSWWKQYDNNDGKNNDDYEGPDRGGGW